MLRYAADSSPVTLGDGGQLAQRAEGIRRHGHRRRRIEHLPLNRDELELDRLCLVDAIKEERHGVALVMVGELARRRLEVVFAFTLRVRPRRHFADAHRMRPARGFHRLVVRHLRMRAMLAAHSRSRSSRYGCLERSYRHSLKRSRGTRLRHRGSPTCLAPSSCHVPDRRRSRRS